MSASVISVGQRVQLHGLSTQVLNSAWECGSARDDGGSGDDGWVTADDDDDDLDDLDDDGDDDDDDHST
jgi:hypothetical protein